VHGEREREKTGYMLGTVRGEQHSQVAEDEEEQIYLCVWQKGVLSRAGVRALA
jgi:hypothetical protein